MRRTVWPRPIISPKPWETSEPGYPIASPYVRTFWTAVLGPGAVADLLRLATAASRGRSLPRPIGLTQLTKAGLAREHDGEVEVRTTIPPLPPAVLQTLPAAIRRRHRLSADEPDAATQSAA